MKNICELKAEYQKILDLPIMRYDTKKMELRHFILENEQDTRKGTVALLNQAEKKIRAIDQELDRVRGMMFLEKRFADHKEICGVDEVGRGPLAGPIFAGAVILPPGLIIPGLNDSKQVSARNRELLYDVILSNAVAVGVGMVSEKVIDEQGLEYANLEAMRRAVRELSVKPDMLLVDAKEIPDLDIPQFHLDKGDANSVSIAAASIVAKVTRDRLMKEYAEKYPEYGFDENAGYGTAAHVAALKKYGPCPIHRRLFLRKILGEDHAE